MQMLTQKQSGVLRGIAAALIVTLASLGLAIFGFLRPLEPGPQAAIPFALRWDTLVLACLAFHIGLLARHRFFTAEDIDGGGLSQGTQSARLLQAILQNTLEQSVLALGVHLVWAATMPQNWQAAVPAAAILFVVGRILFWRGYESGAPGRAFGFGLTFYPSIAMLLIIVGRLAVR